MGIAVPAAGGEEGPREVPGEGLLSHSAQVLDRVILGSAREAVAIFEIHVVEIRVAAWAVVVAVGDVVVIIAADGVGCAGGADAVCFIVSDLPRQNIRGLRLSVDTGILWKTWERTSVIHLCLHFLG